MNRTTIADLVLKIEITQKQKYTLLIKKIKNHFHHIQIEVDFSIIDLLFDHISSFLIIHLSNKMYLKIMLTTLLLTLI